MNCFVSNLFILSLKNHYHPSPEPSPVNQIIANHLSKKVMV